MRKADYRPPAFRVERVELAFDLDAECTRVHSRLWVRRDAAAAPDAPLRLDGEGLSLETLSLDDCPLAESCYRLDARGVTIPSVPERFVLAASVRIQPARNTALLGLYQAGELLCTQCEPEAFRRITFFPDRPDVLASYRVSLTADAERYPVLLANGNPVSHERRPDGRHTVVWEDPHPKPSYLFALVAGDLDRVTDRFRTASGREIALNLYVHPRNTGLCAHALASLRRAMAWDEQAYGREYDLDVYNMLAVSEYTMGAMENKGLTIFNDRRVLTDAATGTDRDHREIEALVAHEYFHNWTGNRITCRDWFQLALKEGFTVFREQQFVADQGRAAVRRIEDVRLMSTRQFAEDAGPLAHAVRPDAYEDIEIFYSDTVYSKGAELIRMLATLLGPERFRAGTDLFFERHDGGAVTVEDFLRCLAEAAGRDLSGFLRWYDRSGTPTLDVGAHFEPASGTFDVTVRQVPPGAAATPLPLPLAMGLLDDAGRSLPLRLSGEPESAAAATRVFELREAQTRLRFVDMPEAPTPALLRGFSAPVHVRFDYRPDQLVRLAIHDPDPVTRWDAVWRLADTAVNRSLTSPGGAAVDTVDLETVFRAVLDRHPAEPGLAAELLTLPDLTALLSGRRDVDVAALDRACTAVRRELAEALRDDLRRTHDRCRSALGTAYRPTPEECGRRRLGSICLGYLMDLGDDDALDRCIVQYRADASLTETLVALELLCHTETVERDEALAAFQERWRNEPMMLDKWLAVQARSRRSDTVQRVRALAADEAFSLDQPNRVRSLVEVFVAENPLRFHQSDGAGYQFLADQVLALDPLNPSLAAVLLRYLGDWRRHEPQRSARMRAALARVAAADLSTGTREVAAACLSADARLMG
ncbi:MAG: aminopeptidase N [Salinisphaera sp.]|uniref:aminopeptidase N n=1 Tax=Salinisphaera sp. TaxID=1914330 RepID=UPI003C7AC7C9